jgi:predicted short-subunit dehydrogenase-like oxidoreductase (DUF2520 family)
MKPWSTQFDRGFGSADNGTWATSGAAEGLGGPSTDRPEQRPAAPPIGSAPLGRLALVGCGAAGRALARWIVAAGLPCPLLWNRSAVIARDLASELGGEWDADLAAVLGRCDQLLIAVSDGALPEFAARAAPLVGPRLKVACHLAGALPPMVLAPLARAGVAVGLLHPLAALVRTPAMPRGNPGAGREGELAQVLESLAGERPWQESARLAFGVRGDPRARAFARQLVLELGAEALLLAEDDGAQMRYHAAAVLVANGLVGLFSAAQSASAGAFQNPADAQRACLALADSSLRQLVERSPAEALTGPIQRGATGLVEQHLNSLASLPQVASLYRELARTLLGLAAPRLNPQSRTALEQLLQDPQGSA